MMADLTFTAGSRPAVLRDLPVALAEVGSASIAETPETSRRSQWDLVLEGVAAGQRLFLSKNRVLLN